MTSLLILSQSDTLVRAVLDDCVVDLGLALLKRSMLATDEAREPADVAYADPRKEVSSSISIVSVDVLRACKVLESSAVTSLSRIRM